MWAGGVNTAENLSGLFSTGLFALKGQVKASLASNPGSPRLEPQDVTQMRLTLRELFVETVSLPKNSSLSDRWTP